jgi:hypothetical protein
MAAKKKSAPVSDAAVSEKTGRDWQGWVQALDAAGASGMTHAEIAKLLSRQFGVGAWWSQMVTVGYEQLTGRRQRLQKSDGYAANASLTIAAPIEDVFRAASSSRTASSWLPKGVIVHRATAPKSMRATDPQGRKTISINFYWKGPEKTQVMAQQEKLASQAEARRLKTTWANSLHALESRVARPRPAGTPTASRKRTGRPPRRK